MAPISVGSMGSSTYEPDTYSLVSQTSSMLTIGDSIPAQMIRRATKRGYTFNIMSVGPNDLNKTTLISALFGKKLDMSYGSESSNVAQGAGDNHNIPPAVTTTASRNFRSRMDHLNPPVSLTAKTFDLEEKAVRLRLTLIESEDYGDALCLHETYQPLVDYIDAQFADYHRRESSFNRRQIRDKMVHCLFFFISPFGHGLSQLDLQFLEAVHTRVNIVPIIARSEGLTFSERLAIKRRVRDDLRKNNIKVYQIGSPDMDDPDDMKKVYKDIQDSLPFAISSMAVDDDGSLLQRSLDWGDIDPYNLEHSDLMLLKTMLHMQISDMCETTHEIFYEDYRLKMLERDPSAIAFSQLRLKPTSDERPK